MNKFFHGSSLLSGNNTVPGVELTPELKKYVPIILKACRDYGFDFYPTIVQLLTYDEISEIAAYGGFPVRYLHWQWGMEYEELQRGYEYGNHKIYELVINCSPCVIYCLNSNTLLDHLTVVAHATGHNHFFKNNVFFSATDTNMINKMANNSTRIRKYMTRWGKEKVTEFIDNVLRLSTLVDGAKAWDSRQYKEEKINDTRNYYYPNKLKVEEGHLYMDPFVNTKGYIDKEKEKVKIKEKADELELFKNPTRDILGFLKDNAPLKPWQADIISMLYEEALYFYPQRQTKMLNEGCASIADHVIMSRQGYVGLGQESDDCGIVEYSQHKMGVLGGKYSTNPYKLGFNLLLDIEERWNKGRFGIEYEECNDIKKKENWDQNLMLGKEKMFEVIKCHNDYTAINEFFTEDFCNKYEFFEWKRYPNGEYKIESRDYKKIKKKLLSKYLNGNLPDIRLTDYNFNGDGSLMLQHYDEGRFLHRGYLYDVLNSVAFIWKNKVHLASYNKDGEEEVFTSIDGQIDQNSRKEFEKKYDRYPSRGE